VINAALNPSEEKAFLYRNLSVTAYNKLFNSSTIDAV
jgi:hypothetical protein